MRSHRFALVAFLGLLLVTFVLKGPGSYGLEALVVLAGVTLGSVLTVAWFMREEWTLLKSAPVLFVPLVTTLVFNRVYMGVLTWTGVDTTVVAGTSPWTSWVAFLPVLLVTFVGVGWTLALVLQVARGEALDLGAGLRTLQERFVQLAAVKVAYLILWLVVIFAGLHSGTGGLLLQEMVFTGALVLALFLALASWPTLVMNGAGIANGLRKSVLLPATVGWGWAGALLLQQILRGAVMTVEHSEIPGEGTADFFVPDLNAFATQSGWLESLRASGESGAVDLVHALLAVTMVVLVQLKLARAVVESEAETAGS